jgi:hypothetical protein
MTIDISTGLPALPEGQYWRVSNDYNVRGAYPERFVSVNLMRVTHIRKRRYIDFLFEIPWGYIEYDEHTLLDESPVWSETPHSPEWVSNNLQVDLRDGYPMATIDELTPTMILKTAEELLARYKKKQENLSLLGDYPPKKLEVNA